MSPFAAYNATFSAASIVQSSGLINAATLPIYEFMTYKPANDTIVWSAQQTIFYHPSDEAMFGITNRYLEAIDWIQGIAWENHSKADQVYQYSFETALSIIQGNEVSLEVDVGASYFGLSISFEYGTKTFKSTETTNTHTTTVTITVPPESHLVFYQRRYDFRDETTFACDSSRQYYNVGTYGKTAPLTKKVSRVQIMADEYFTAVAPLRTDKVGTISPRAAEAFALPELSKTRESITTRAKAVLTALHI